MTNSLPISVERTFSAPQQQVWEALTDKKKMQHWYFTIPNFELEVGAEFDFFGGEKAQYHHQGKILAIKPYELLQHTWHHPSHSKGTSVLTWFLIPRGNATTVRLVHEGVESFADAGEDFTRESYEKGWNTILSVSLAQFLEN